MCAMCVLYCHNVAMYIVIIGFSIIMQFNSLLLFPLRMPHRMYDVSNFSFDSNIQSSTVEQDWSVVHLNSQATITVNPVSCTCLKPFFLKACWLTDNCWRIESDHIPAERNALTQEIWNIRELLWQDLTLPWTT